MAHKRLIIGMTHDAAIAASYDGAKQIGDKFFIPFQHNSPDSWRAYMMEDSFVIDYYIWHRMTDRLFEFV